ncbi:hypothetical protein [Kribbella catacumbae]|uniref:hypothetical protein n=1 Tax=Kribbella catacumbae TaxID=460086 RepID=UPI0003660463|nr:hypothetical protein [Kribbella catacumbae]
MATKSVTLVLSEQDALNVAAQAKAARVERRQGRTIYRLRRQAAPWYYALAVFAFAEVLWLVSALSTTSAAVWTAALAAIPLGIVGWTIGRNAGAWRRRVWASNSAANAWLIWAASMDPASLDSHSLALLVLMLVTMGLAAGWWKANRIPHPLAPSAPEPEEAKQFKGPLHQRWTRFVASSRGPLPESYLTQPDISNGKQRYTIQLVPGQQTQTLALSSLDRISSGLNVPIKNLVLEPHPNELPTQMRITYVEKSPIDKVVLYDGPKVDEGVIQIGPYGDGEGCAGWRYWTRGEVPMGGSWWGGAIIAGMGSGKSRLMELLAVGTVATGHAVAWFIDPQGGASSPALAKAADWYVDLDGAEKMLTALESICEWRSKEMAANGWIGVDPSPERPGITVFIDEAHEVFAENTDRWTKLARKARKVGIALVILSQYPGLSTFGGSEPLRAAVMAGNVVAMRTESRQNGQLLVGLDVDPLTLPAIPGFGYTVRRGNEFGRTAPFRAEYVKVPAEWLARYPSPELDPVSANAGAANYINRRSDMDSAMALVRAQVEAMKNGDLSAASGLVGAIATATKVATGKPSANPLQLPPPPVLTLVKPAAAAPRPAPPEPANGREALLAILANGETKTKDLIEGARLSETRFRQLIGELTTAKLVEKVGRGVYRLVEG